jgi:hypothetical protein
MDFIHAILAAILGKLKAVQRAASSGSKCLDTHRGDPPKLGRVTDVKCDNCWHDKFASTLRERDKYERRKGSRLGVSSSFKPDPRCLRCGARFSRVRMADHLPLGVPRMDAEPKY